VFGVWLLLAAIGGAYALRAALKRAGPKAAWDRAVLRSPLFGRLARGIDTARFASTLAMLVEAGVPILRALAAAEATLTNSVLRASVMEATQRVREGVGLARALRPTKAFPPVLIRLIEVGEATGQLPRMLTHAAHNQTREVERNSPTIVRTAASWCRMPAGKASSATTNAPAALAASSQRAQLCRREFPAPQVGDQPVRTARDMPQMKGDRCKLPRTRIQFLIRQVSTPLLYIFFRQFERMQDGALHRVHFRQGAA